MTTKTPAPATEPQVAAIKRLGALAFSPHSAPVDLLNMARHLGHPVADL